MLYFAGVWSKNGMTSTTCKQNFGIGPSSIWTLLTLGPTFPFFRLKPESS